MLCQHGFGRSTAFLPLGLQGSCDVFPVFEWWDGPESSPSQEVETPKFYATEGRGQLGPAQQTVLADSKSGRVSLDSSSGPDEMVSGMRRGARLGSALIWEALVRALRRRPTYAIAPVNSAVGTLRLS